MTTSPQPDTPTLDTPTLNDLEAGHILVTMHNGTPSSPTSNPNSPTSYLSSGLPNLTIPTIDITMAPPDTQETSPDDTIPNQDPDNFLTIPGLQTITNDPMEQINGPNSETTPPPAYLENPTINPSNLHGSTQPTSTSTDPVTPRLY